MFPAHRSHHQERKIVSMSNCDNGNSIMKNEDFKLLFSVTFLVTADAGLIPSLNKKLRIIKHIHT